MCHVSCVTPCTNRKPRVSDWLCQREVLYNHQDKVFFKIFFNGASTFQTFKWTREKNRTDLCNILSGIQVRNAIDRNGFCVPKLFIHHIYGEAKG